jgi:hypothetical protein
MQRPWIWSTLGGCVLLLVQGCCQKPLTLSARHHAQAQQLAAYVAACVTRPEHPAAASPREAPGTTPPEESHCTPCRTPGLNCASGLP